MPQAKLHVLEYAPQRSWCREGRVGPEWHLAQRPTRSIVVVDRKPYLDPGLSRTCRRGALFARCRVSASRLRPSLEFSTCIILRFSLLSLHRLWLSIGFWFSRSLHRLLLYCSQISLYLFLWFLPPSDQLLYFPPILKSVLFGS